MKQIILKLAISIGFVLIVFSLCRGISSGAIFRGKEYSYCQAEKKAEKIDFEGILVEKFKDEANHLYETLKINTSEGTIKTTIFVLEKSGLFDKLEVGDYLVKMENSLEIKVDDKNMIYTMNFECK